MYRDRFHGTDCAWNWQMFWIANVKLFQPNMQISQCLPAFQLNIHPGCASSSECRRLTISYVYPRSFVNEHAASPEIEGIQAKVDPWFIAANKILELNIHYFRISMHKNINGLWQNTWYGFKTPTWSHGTASNVDHMVLVALYRYLMQQCGHSISHTVRGRPLSDPHAIEN